jgi:hypothetical protein
MEPETRSSRGDAVQLGTEGCKTKVLLARLTDAEEVGHETERDRDVTTTCPRKATRITRKRTWSAMSSSWVWA